MKTGKNTPDMKEQEDNTVGERLKEFIRYKKISVRKFEQTCGFSYGFIANMRVSTHPAKLKAMNIKYPDLNISWLMTGIGEMIISPDKENIITEGTGKYGNTVKSGDAAVSIPVSLWNIIEKQADSLKVRDKQIDDLIALMKNFMQK